MLDVSGKGFLGSGGKENGDDDLEDVQVGFLTVLEPLLVQKCEGESNLIRLLSVERIDLTEKLVIEPVEHGENRYAVSTANRYSWMRGDSNARLIPKERSSLTWTTARWGIVQAYGMKVAEFSGQ